MGTSSANVRTRPGNSANTSTSMIGVAYSEPRLWLSSATSPSATAPPASRPRRPQGRRSLRAKSSAGQKAISHCAALALGYPLGYSSRPPGSRPCRLALVAASRCSATKIARPISARVHAPSSIAALAPRWRQQANSANTSRYSNVRLAPSQASPRTPAHVIDRKLSSVYAASAARAILTGVGTSLRRRPTAASVTTSSPSTIRAPGPQWVSG